jgi:hypothetical protein
VQTILFRGQKIGNISGFNQFPNFSPRLPINHRSSSVDDRSQRLFLEDTLMTHENLNPQDPTPKQHLTRSILVPISGLATQLRNRIGPSGKIRAQDITAVLKRKFLIIVGLGIITGAAIQYGPDLQIFKSWLGRSAVGSLESPSPLAAIPPGIETDTLTTPAIVGTPVSAKVQTAAPETTQPPIVHSKKKAAKDKISKSNKGQATSKASAKNKKTKKKRTTNGIASAGR